MERTQIKDLKQKIDEKVKVSFVQSQKRPGWIKFLLSEMLRYDAGGF